MIKSNQLVHDNLAYSHTHEPIAIWRKSANTEFIQIVLYKRQFGSLYLTLERGFAGFVDSQTVLSYSWWQDVEYNLALALIPENFEDYDTATIVKLLDTFIKASSETEKSENYQVRLYHFDKSGFQVSIFRNWVNEYSQADIHITDIDLYTLIAGNWVCVGMPSKGCSHYRLYSRFGSN